MNEVLKLDDAIRGEVDNLNPKAVVVSNQQERDDITMLVKGARLIRSRVESFFKEMKSNAYTTWKSICNLESSYTKKCDDYEKAANNAILAYDAKVKAEQDRLAKEAEDKRRAEEKAKADAEAARQIAEDGEDESTMQDRESIVAEVNVAVDKAAADRLAADAARAQTFVHKDQGETVRVTLKARVIDHNLVPREYMIPDQKMLDAVAKSKKDQINAKQFSIPGVVFYEDRTIVRK